MTRFLVPTILLNFKSYTEATGRKALKLSKIAEDVSLETEICIGLAPQFSDLATIAQSVSIPVFSQHIDPIKPGSFTGHILPEAVKEAGAVGTLINHSEKQLKLQVIYETVKRARETDLVSVVCVISPEVSLEVASFKPDIVAIEPPELIGTGVAVSKAKPKLVSSTVELVKKAHPSGAVLCGAGVIRGDDVACALKLGADGVLVASGVVRARDPYNVLLEFAEAAAKSQKFGAEK
jgi:triosephosphate isomerase